MVYEIKRGRKEIVKRGPEIRTFPAFIACVVVDTCIPYQASLEVASIHPYGIRYNQRKKKKKMSFDFHQGFPLFMTAYLLTRLESRQSSRQ